MNSHTPYLSIIIPAYKEKERIGTNLLAIKKYVEQRQFSYEVLVVVDGSPDNTADVVRGYGAEIPHLRVIANPRNRGKGYVIRQGLLEATGTYRLFLDADGSTSITHADKALELLAGGADLVVGSRDIPGAYIQVHQPRYREIMGDMGNILIRVVLGLWSFPDTQCGFKAMRATVAEAVASRMVVDRFGFDFELIILAKKLGFTVVQMPVRWLNEEGSTVGFTGPNGFVRVLIDLCKTRLRLWTGAYRIGAYRQQQSRQK